jgi:hypothetical protein
MSICISGNHYSRRCPDSVRTGGLDKNLSNAFGISITERRIRVASPDSETNPEEGGPILRQGNEHNYHGVNIVCFMEG